MNEMRYDWLGDRWVIFAPNRILRPDNYRDPSSPKPTPVSLEPTDRITDEHCPFCSGQERQTPSPTLVLKTPSAHDWSVRVVPNKFPAFDSANQSPLCTAPQCNSANNSANNSDLFLRKQTRGGHEVIIEAPNHIQSITQLPSEHAALIFEAYQERLRYWRSVHAMRYAVVFKNNGADAGASLVHAHSQLICTDFLPTDVLKTQLRSIEYFQTHRRCYACDVLEKEIQSNQRIVAQTDSFVALCPFASRLPYSVSILPIEHQSAFEECTPCQLVELARLVQWTLRSIECEHPQAAYNYVLQTAPLDAHNPAAFHWRLKVLPRLIKVAGFEWSSDCYINTVLPEEAASALGRHFPTGLLEKPISRTAIA